MKKPTLLPLAALFLIAGLCLLGCEESSPAKEKDYTVSFDLNGATGSIAPQTIAEGAKVNKPADPTRDGYTFDGWYIAGATSSYNFDEAVKANFTLQARWLSQATDLSLSYDGQAITPTQNNFAIAVASTVDVAALSLTFTVAVGAQLREGSTAIALSNNTVTKEFDFSVDKTKTFNVRAEDGTTQATYTVAITVRSDTAKEITRFSFLAANNTALSADVEATLGEDTIKAVLPAGTAVTSLTPTIVHTGASINPETGAALDFSNDVTYTVTAQNEDTKTYTVRVRVLQAGEQSYTVRFVTPTDATAVNSQTVVEGEMADSPPNPSRENYRFDGWYRAANGSGDVYDFTTTAVAEDITLYAKWVRQYTVTFDTGNKATAISAVMVDSAAKVSSPEVIPNAGFTFDGWYTDETTTQEYDFTTATVTANITLYAKWAAAVATGFLIPDVNFRTALKENISAAFEGEYMDTTHSSVLSLTALDVASKNISSLAGIEYFMALTTLDCGTNSLTELDITKNTALTTLYCYNNSLATLDVTQHTALTTLDCGTNSLTELDVTKNTALTELYCESNQLSSLDLRGRKRFSFLTINAGSTDNEGTATNPLTQLYVHTDLQTHDEIQEAKTNLETAVTISTYNDANALVCANFDPNDGVAGICLSLSGANTLEGLASNTSPEVPADLENYPELVQDILSPYAAGATLVFKFLKVNAAGTGDASSWDNAGVGSESGLKSTIDDISDASTTRVYVILLAAGIYQPSAVLSMKNNMAIVGGFSATLNWARMTSDTTSLDGNNDKRLFTNASLNNTALLYGVKITRGNPGNFDGGGMYNGTGSSPSLINVTFFGNNANSNGGGMYNDRNSSSPRLINVTFFGNNARYGGGMYNNTGSSPSLTDVTFSGNLADDGGGGMYNNESSPMLTNVTFSKNVVEGGHGGGMYNENSSPILINTTFFKNKGVNGGGMYNDNSSPILVGVTSSGNRASNYGGGIYNGNGSTPLVVNGLFWDDQAQSGGPVTYQTGEGSSVIIRSSVLDNRSPNSVNTNTVEGADYHLLQSITYLYVTTADPDPNPFVNGALADNGGKVQTIKIDDVAVNKGWYVRRSGAGSDVTLYYSTDNSNWYTSFPFNTETKATLPASATDLTATDATGYTRTGRPDAGAYEAR